MFLSDRHSSEYSPALPSPPSTLSADSAPRATNCVIDVSIESLEPWMLHCTWLRQLSVDDKGLYVQSHIALSVMVGGNNELTLQEGDMFGNITVCVITCTLPTAELVQ